ncbi:MAG TPA: hypothetical protein VGF84_11450 [Micromonosporaceae bacterium]
MPTSVLLAVLAAAGLLALAPALVRRYDATERLAAERAQSTARVLDRTRRRRTVPVAGRSPFVGVSHQDVVRTTGTIGRAVWLEVSRPSSGTAPAAEISGSETEPAVESAVPAPPAPITRPAPATRSAPASRGPARPPSTRSGGVRSTGGARPTPARSTGRRVEPRRTATQHSPAVYRRRRVLALLVVLNVIEVIGITTVSPGFWTGFAVTMLLLIGYVVHLRNSSIADARIRRISARRAAVVAAEQAEIRATHARRIAARREALRRAAAARANAQRDAQRLSQRYVDYDPQRGARVRGRPYEHGAGYDERAAGF